MAKQHDDRIQPGQPSGGTSKPLGPTPARSAQPNPSVPSGGNFQPAGAETSGDIGEAASSLYEQAKGTASETYDAVAAKANSALEDRKSSLSAGLKSVADSFKKTGTELRTTGESNQLTDLTSKYTGTAAAKLEDLAGYFERKDLRAMMRDVEGFARRNPAIFLGAAFGLGLLAARFLKSSPPTRGETARSNTFDTERGSTVPISDRSSAPTPPAVG
jgi:hypothetical protein